VFFRVCVRRESRWLPMPHHTPVSRCGALCIVQHLFPSVAQQARPQRKHRLRVLAYQPTAEGPAEDYHLWSRLAQRGAQFANLAEPLVRYRLHPGQMKALYTRRTIRAVLEVKQRYWVGAMDFRARLRMLQERLAVRLPEPLLHRLLVWTHYRDDLPGEPVRLLKRDDLPRDPVCPVRCQ